MSGSVRGEMPQRLLRLLSLLQLRREWSGAELTERLGVSARTLRRDVERLRGLDYQVEGTPGVAGGYRLASGRDLPPLLLDDEEAVATALGLVTVTGVGDSAPRALAKLERVLPARLRPRLAAVRDTASAVPHVAAPVRVDPTVLGLLASLCRDRVVTGFDYRDRAGNARERRVEPHHLVAHGGHWYLIAHDTDRDDWRTFRVDRVSGPRATHRRFTPRPLPAPDPAAFLTRLFAAGVYGHTVRVTVGLSAEAFRTRFHGPLPGGVEPLDDHGCRVRISADSLDLVCQYTAAVLSLGAPFTLEAPPEVAERLRALASGLAGVREHVADGHGER
ncbi:DNA-binding transcriptional regulator [Nocardiopsis sp. TSRI0078]|uniref:helix-turn-helix transcriptional regulator n=1 Tax=unclassified Nocardiopsis TaxID=2649073 RepID=UPI00093CAD9A|nr:YafY family protein [Nocardiopsis sp. TSRI0078]OKI17952.1 DNA-binding transcriptional regulator [Nocardiopsis sp. TSRI0078]